MTGEKVKKQIKTSKMDSRHGLDYIVENAEYTTKLGAGKYENLILITEKNEKFEITFIFTEPQNR